MTHAFLSASGAPAWMRCHIKPWRELNAPDNSNKYAKEGTIAHELLERTIKDGRKDAYVFESAYQKDMCLEVQKTIDYIYSLEGDTIYSEARLDISHLTDEEDAKGTADCIIYSEDVLTVVDLKYGMGVEVQAEGNEQLLIYASAALKEYDIAGTVQFVKMVIHQPRLNAVSEWVLALHEFNEWENKIRETAKIVIYSSDLKATPGEKQCKFCKVKSSCSEYRNMALKVIATDFDILPNLSTKVLKSTDKIPTITDDELATCADAVGLIESWCKGVRSELERRLLHNAFESHRYKLVQGKKGNRKFVNEENVIDVLTSHGVDIQECSETKLNSPAKLEKTLKKANPLLWERIQPYIIQNDGGVSVAKDSDPRPALNFTPDFENLEFTESLIGLRPENE